MILTKPADLAETTFYVQKDTRGTVHGNNGFICFSIKGLETNLLAYQPN